MINCTIFLYIMQNLQIDNIKKLSVESLNEMLKKEQINSLHIAYEKHDNCKILENIAIIYGFFGTDIFRILATTRALSIMLKSDPKPQDIVFVEAQRNKDNAAFAWLENYGVKYIFKEYTEESEGLLLKTALWNIGAASTNAEKLCFIDSDIVFCNQDWLESVYSAFDQFDVLSLAGQCYYEGDNQAKELIESIGHRICRTHDTEFYGHIGFNIGMTRKSYIAYGKFEAFNLNDDVWFWTKILGTNIYNENKGWIPYKTDENMKYGLPFKIGSTEEICCHLDHKKKIIKNKLYGWISYLGTDVPFEDISYEKDIPTWTNTKAGKTIKLAFEKAKNVEADNENCKQLAQQILLDAKKEVYGEIDKEHPLVIMTAFVPDFRHKNIESIFEHREMLERTCKQSFTYVCFTNEISVEDAQKKCLDVIPFSSISVKNNRNLWKTEMNRKDIKLPKNSTVIWIDINTVFKSEFEITRNK